MPNGFSLPAEWAPQDGVVMAWPHADTDWAAHLDQVEPSFVAIAAAIAKHERVLLITPDDALARRVKALLAATGVAGARIRSVTLPYDDTWLRDSGPLTLRAADGRLQLLDFRFTGWGGKFAAERDDALVAELVASGQFGSTPCQRIDWALEGGAIESDGAGTVLTTWQCLQQRHPDMDRDALAAFLKTHSGARQVLGLEYGHLEGDDTDAHIDTLARFAPNATIVFQACDDVADTHYGALALMADELAELRTADGRPYRLLPLPWPRPVIDHGRRLPASYANYLIINDAVLIPSYDDPADAEAIRVIAAAYPGREMISVPCRPLIWQNGSLHCLTMQLPAGLLA